MAWTTLTFAFGSKLTSTKMTQLQDNFAALAAGDSGAPVINAPPVNSAGGTGYCIYGDHADESGDLLSHGSTSLTKKWEATVPCSGTLSVTFTLRDSSPAVSVTGRIYRNGVAVGTLRTKSTSSYTTYTENISGWSVGDLIQIYLQCSNVSDTAKVGKVVVEANVGFVMERSL